MKTNLGFTEGMIVGMSKPRGKTKFMDWQKVQKIVKENPDSIIYAGLMEDWQCTSCLIYAKGKYYKGNHFYGGSHWATPIVDVDDKEIECWTYEKTQESYYFPKWWGNGQPVLNEDDFFDEVVCEISNKLLKII